MNDAKTEVDFVFLTESLRTCLNLGIAGTCVAIIAAALV